MMESQEEKSKSKSKKSLKDVNLKLSFSLSPMTKWILTILILGVGVVLVVVFYAQEQTRNSDLKSEVDEASSALIQNSLKRRDAESRLAAAGLELAVLEGQFPSARQSMDVEEALFSAAADSGVVVTSINCDEPEAGRDSMSSYRAFRINVSFQGDSEGFLSLIGRLGYWLPSAEIESVSASADSISLTLRVYAGVGE